MKNIWMIGFLTLIWCGFSNYFGLANIIFGIIMATVCCFLLPAKNDIHYNIRPIPLITLLVFTLYELIKSSLMVAWDIITPSHRNDSKILDIELSCRNDIERTVLANLISLTPGTLTINLSEDKKSLKVHVMFGSNPQETIDFIKKQLEPKVLKVFKYANT